MSNLPGAINSILNRMFCISDYFSPFYKFIISSGIYVEFKAIYGDQFEKVKII